MSSHPNFPVAPDPAVDFVRYNPDGSILSRGRMHPDLIAAEAAAGGLIRPVDQKWETITQNGHKVDVGTGKIVTFAPLPDPSKKLADVKAHIAKLLSDTDKYFVDDWQENITAQEKAQWKEYRKALRDANKNPDAASILAALPASMPNGQDPFARLRSS
jgi:hypothetical protein